MEKMEFPWLREIKPITQEEESEQRPQPLWKKIPLMKLRPYAMPLLLMCFIAVLAILGRSSNSAPTSQNKRGPQSELLVMSLVAIPKGHLIPVEALAEVRVRTNTLSKAQRLRALVPEHLTKITYAIVAKKDIAPQTPLFWTDFMLKQSPRSSPSVRKTRIFFDESGASL